MASNKFKPKASNNIIEGATPVEETEVAEEVVEETPAPEETSVEEKKTKKGSKKTAEKSEEEEPVTEEPSVVFDDTDSKECPIEKSVKVCLNTNHTCSIGGVFYHFEKGKQTVVPLSVKTILNQAGLLMPL